VGTAACKSSYCLLQDESEYTREKGEKGKSKIGKGELRFYKLSARPERFGGEGDMKQYYHHECWADQIHRMLRNTVKPLATGDYVGYDALDDAHKKQVKEILKRYEDELAEGYKPYRKSPQKKKKEEGEENGSSSTTSSGSKSKSKKNKPFDFNATYRGDVAGKLKEWMIEVAGNVVRQCMSVVDSKNAPSTQQLETESNYAANEKAREMIDGKLNAGFELIDEQPPGATTKDLQEIREETTEQEEEQKEEQKKEKWWPGKPQEPPPLAGQRPPPPEGQDGCFDGISIVVTGTLDSLSRDEAQELIQRYGGKAPSTVTGNTSYLLVGPHGHAGESKIAKAKEFGVPLLDNEEALFDLLRNPEKIQKKGKPSKAKSASKKKSKKEEESDEEEEIEEAPKKKQIKSKKKSGKRKKKVEDDEDDED